MSDVNPKMHEVEADTNGHHAVDKRLKDIQNGEKHDITESVRHLFHVICEDIAKNPNVCVAEQDNQPGFSVNLTNAIDGALVPFIVTTSCTADAVTIQTADGKWDEASNVHGNWGAWSDVKIMYEGPVEEGKIQDVIERAFLAWYRRVYKPM